MTSPEAAALPAYQLFTTRREMAKKSAASQVAGCMSERDLVYSCVVQVSRTNTPANNSLGSRYRVKGGSNKVAIEAFLAVLGP